MAEFAALVPKAKPSQKALGGECEICYEDNENLVAFSCGHLVHPDCFADFLFSTLEGKLKAGIPCPIGCDYRVKIHELERVLG